MHLDAYRAGQMCTHTIHLTTAHGAIEVWTGVKLHPPAVGSAMQFQAKIPAATPGKNPRSQSRQKSLERSNITNKLYVISRKKKIPQKSPHAFRAKALGP